MRRRRNGERSLDGRLLGRRCGRATPLDDPIRPNIERLYEPPRTGTPEFVRYPFLAVRIDCLRNHTRSKNPISDRQAEETRDRLVAIDDRVMAQVKDRKSTRLNSSNEW